MTRTWRRRAREQRSRGIDMEEFAATHPILLAALAGFACALIFASIPVGPINLTILNEGARRGFAWAFFIGLGATAMDAIYCGISFTGIFSSLATSATIRSGANVLSRSICLDCESFARGSVRLMICP